jgi:hypothetical protein
MTQRNEELEIKWETFSKSQLEQSERAERFELEQRERANRMESSQDQTNQKLDNVVGELSGLSSSLTGLTVELRHVVEGNDRVSKEVDAITKRVTLLEINGASRETKLKIIIGVITAAFASLVTWFINNR